MNLNEISFCTMLFNKLVFYKGANGSLFILSLSLSWASSGLRIKAASKIMLQKEAILHSAEWIILKGFAVRENGDQRAPFTGDL